jgi:hypothetical protein
MSDGSILDAAASEIPGELRDLGDVLIEHLGELADQIRMGRVQRRDRWAGEFFALLLMAKISERGCYDDIKDSHLGPLVRQAWRYADMLCDGDPKNDLAGVAAAGDE